MKVLSVQHYPVFGGPHNEILLLENGLNAQHVETIVLLTSDAGNAAERLRPRVELRTIPLARARRSLDPRLNLSSMGQLRHDVKRLRSVIRRERPDVVKVHGPHNPQGALAAVLEGVPVVWVLSSTAVPNGFRRLGMQLVRRFADAVLVTGHAVLDTYPGGASLGDKVFVYYPPVDVEAFHPLSSAEREGVRQELGIPLDAPLVGTVANVNPHKGLETFVAGAARVHARLPRAHFLVVGAYGGTQASYYEEVKHQAAEAGLWPRHLHFLGERRDISRVLGAFDVSTVTSIRRSEGMPTTALEAMACGIPVVSTAVGAIREAIEDGRSGFVVPPGDADALGERILSLLDDRAASKSMGTRARDRAAEQFTVQRCVDAHVAAYRHASRQPSTAVR